MSIASAFKSLAELAAKKAPYDDALALAQRNAALPIERGGLGLAPDNTAMDRARAMGYTTPAKHVTAADIDAFDLSRASPTGKWGRAVYAATDDKKLPLLEKAVAKREGVEGLNVMPLMLRQSSPYDLLENGLPLGQASAEKLSALGYSGAVEPGAQAIFDPSNIRSRFAAFDPFRRGESDLLAGLAPYAVPAVGLAGLGAMAAPGESEASPYSALADLYKSVGKKLPWTERELMAGLPKGRGVAPQDLALEAARREGEAIGLPAGNSAADRARAGGFDTEFQHGTPDDFSRIDLDKLQRSDHGYMGRGLYGGKLGGTAYADTSAMPLMMPSKGAYILDDASWSPNAGPYVEMSDRIKALGFDRQNQEMKNAAAKRYAEDMMAKGYHGVIDTAGNDGNIAQVVVYDPSKVRSRHAAMNPALKDSSNLLAGLGGAAVGAGALMAPGEAEASPYANMMALKRAADARARTHVPRASMTPGAQAARAMAIEAMNPASWPLLWGSRELGDPQALNYSDPYYSYSGGRR